MKRKHVIATFALSALMGIGVFAGVRANKVKEAKAATATTVYCAVDVASLKTTYSISDENFVMKCNVNRKGDGDDWATYTMLDTKSVYDSKTVYSASFTDLYDGLGCIQFQVHDQSKGDKSWQEQDQVFGTKSWTSAATYNGKIHVYGGSGWATYTPSSYKVNVYVDGNLRGEETVGAGALPVTPTLNFGQRFSGWFNNAEMTEGHEVEAITGATTVYGAVINIPTVTYNLDLAAVSEAFAHPYLHAWNNLKNHEWPGVALTGNTFTVPNDAQIIIANSADGSTVTAQTVDIAQSGVANDTLTVLATQTEGKYNYVWESEKCTATLSVKFDADVPDYADIYIPGAFNGWSDDVIVSKMTRVSDTEFTYALNDIMPGTYGYKIVACYTGATKMDWDHQVTTSDQSLEFTAEDDGKTINLGTKTYDFATNMPEPVVDHNYALKVNGGTPIALTKSGEEYYVEGITVAAGDTFTFTKDEVAYAVTAEDVGNNNYGKNGVRQAGTVNLYLKPASDHFWVSGLPAPEEGQATYYMLINDKNPVKMTDNTAATANEFYLTHVELAADDEVSFMYISEAQESPVYAHYNITTVEGIEDFYKEGNVVKAAGIYDLYADMTPDHNKLYVAINHDGWVRYLDINGTKQAMTVNPDNDKEYKLTANLVAGDELAYYYGADAESATEQTSTAKAIYNNNLGADKKVLVDAQNADIYVNIETGEIWVGGIATAGYHIIKNGHTLVAMTHGDEYDGYDQWFSASIEFAKDDEITFINATEARGNQLPEIFGIGTVEESDEGAKFEVVDGTPKVIKAKEAVTTKVYLKLKYGMDRVYFGAEEQYIRAAKAFAKDFKDNLATACKASGQQKAVEDAWKDAVDAYALLAKEAKDELKLGALSSVEEVREFGARYTWFLEHKSTWNLDNFLGWEIQASNDVMGLTADDTTMTVVVISAIAVISAAGLFFLIRRKRRLVK